MKVTNDIIASKFSELADLLEIEGANPFRVRAYRKAALAVSSLGQSVADMIAEGQDLTDIPGIGKDLAAKVDEIIKSGDLLLLKQTETKVPHILSELMKIEGLGPKRVKVLHQQLKITSLRDLRNAIDQGSLQQLKGFGPQIANKIKQGIEHAKEYAKKSRLAEVSHMADLLIAHMRSSKNIKQVEIAGSFRRRRETVGDLDLLASAKDIKASIKHFLAFDHIEKITAQGEKRAAVRLNSGLQVDFRVVKDEQFGAALLYFTGSKDHNIAIRKLAIDKKLKLNEYGLFKGTKNIASRTESEVYHAIGLSYIEPELREAHGEIEASLSGTLPKLIEQKDIMGDLHVHTKETDGTETLEKMVLAAKEMGYDYVAITDHSQHLTVANGLNEKRLLAQIKKIDKLNAKLTGITVLKSIELDILEKGRLDLSNTVLKELDLTVCSIHSRFGLSLKEQTDRIIRAMDNRYFNILAHPTGRLINRRQPYQVDLEAIMKAALERGCFLEINAQPERLDLNDIYCKMANDLGLKLVISTDAHATPHFNYMKFGIFQARRGWLQKSDVINTLSLARLKRILKR